VKRFFSRDTRKIRGVFCLSSDAVKFKRDHKKIHWSVALQIQTSSSFNPQARKIQVLQRSIQCDTERA